MYLSPTKRVLSVILVLAMVFCFCAIATPQANAKEYPTIVFVAIDEDGNQLGQPGSCYDFGEVTAGDLLRLRLYANYDDGYPLDPNYTMFNLTDPSAVGGYRFDITEEDYTYYHTLEIDPTWANGQYKIQQAQIHNTNDKNTIAYASWFKFTVVGCGEEDNEGPVLDSFALSSKNAGPGDSIQVTAKAHDEKTTMAKNKVSRIPGTLSAVFSSDDQTINAVMVYDPEDGTYKASIDLDENTPFGTYTLQTLTMKDRKGNTTVFNPAEESLDLADYQFVYSDKDMESPEITEFILDKTVTKIGEKITFILKAEDASGIDLTKTNVTFSNGSRNYTATFQPTSEPDVYNATVNLTCSYKTGTYTVNTLQVYDTEGNITELEVEDCTFEVYSWLTATSFLDFIASVMRYIAGLTNIAGGGRRAVDILQFISDISKTLAG